MAVLGQGGRLVLKRPYHEGTYTFSEGQLDTTCHRINGAQRIAAWNGDQTGHWAADLLRWWNPGKVSGFASYYGSKWF